MATLNEAYVFARDAPLAARVAFSAAPTKTLFNPGVEFPLHHRGKQEDR